MLGIAAPIPPDLIEECDADSHTAELTRHEATLVRRMDQSQFPQVLDIKADLSKLRDEMREHRLPREVMEIHDGDTIGLKGTTEMLEGLPEGVVLADFVYVDTDQPLRAPCYCKGPTYFPALMHDVSMDA